MGTILASAIVSSARVTLLDPAPGVAWSDAGLLASLNEAQRNTALLRPDLYTVRRAIPMVLGTLQELPADGTVLIRLDQNVVSGRRCRLVDAAMLDAVLQSWPASTAEVDVHEYATSDKDRKRFHVLPPNSGAGSVVAHFGAIPPVLASLDAAITLDDVWELVLKHFVLGEAYAANTKRQDLSKATFYRQSFEKMLGINAQATVALAPKYGATPGGA